MKKIKYFMLGLVALCAFGTINIKADDTVILGESVFRKSATEATVNFISNVDGEVYYIVNEKSSVSIAEFPLESNAGNVLNNETKTIDLSLTSGKKYIHIIVKDETNNYSNILTISMPKNLYYFDDFEAYNIDSYPKFFTIKYEGGHSFALQKVIYDNENSESKVFQGYGTYGRGLDERVQFNSLTSGYAILEADVLASSIPTQYFFGGIVIGENYESDDRNIIVQVDRITKKFMAVNHVSDIEFEANTNYHVKIVVDVSNHRYDYYINGIKANTAPIVVRSYEQLNWFGIYNGDGTVYYDNIKFYCQTTDPNIHFITKGLETDGNTFTINKTSAEKDEIITITPTPALGYRVKYVKINNSESGITNNATNYTFTMPEEDVEVSVEFEKIPFTITVDEVEGVATTPNGTIDVKYGDNRDITIIADKGYKIVSVKVNDVELPLINDKITITNIMENKRVVVTLEKIEYKVVEGDKQKHIVGKEENAVFKINADKSLFDKAYLNDEELFSEFYTISEGSTIITLKQEFLNNLLPGTYDLKATFSDGGEANATFEIDQPLVNPKTGDNILNLVIIGIASLIGLFVAGICKKKKFDQ